MKILIDQLADINADHIRVAEELRKKHEIAYWIRIEEVVPLDKSLFPGTVFHSYQDAMRGIAPKEVDASAFEPWSRDAIVAFSAWESEFMTMIDKVYPAWPVDKRKDFYYDLLRYWGGVLDRFAPDLILFNAPPHQVFNFVLYAIAKERGIPTLLFDENVAISRVIGCRDYKEGNGVLAKWRGSGEASLPPYMERYFQELSRTKEPTPAYLTEFKRASTPVKNLVRRLKSLTPHIKDGSIFERATRRFFQLWKPRLSDIYRSLEKAPDFGIPFVYLALHYQPECTTSPQGGIYVEQILMVKTLAAALPKGWELYVKEHPAQWPAHWGDFNPHRYRGYYEEIARVPNVRIVPMATSTFELNDRARATATAGGTAAWESIMRGKCALIFGYPWFMHAPGILRVGSVEECREALQKVAGGFKPKEEEMRAYLNRYDAVSFPGSLSAPGKPDTSDVAWKEMLACIERALAAL